MGYACWEGGRKLRKQLRQWWFPLAWVQVAGSCLTLAAPPTFSFGQLPISAYLGGETGEAGFLWKKSSPLSALFQVTVLD